MSEKEKLMGEATLIGNPQSGLKLVIGDNAVKTKHIADDSITTDKIKDKNVTTEKLADDAVTADKVAENAIGTSMLMDEAVTSSKIGKGEVKTENIRDRAVTNEKLASGAVTTEKIANEAITPVKFAPNTATIITAPAIRALDAKYTNITNELYSLVRSLQPNGVALSNQFGDREDIGITQKTLTKALGKFWEVIEELTGETYMDFTLTVVPTTIYSESSADVIITADCTDAISDFDSIGIYINDELIASSSDISLYTITATIDTTSEIKAIGMILGKTFTKTATVVKEIPFFMGSGSEYTDVMTEEFRQVIVNDTLEGDYDTIVKNDDEHIFIIIPASRKIEFRRADMNGYEIPLDLIIDNEAIVVYKSQNTYKAGTYNIDIDIDS